MCVCAYTCMRAGLSYSKSQKETWGEETRRRVFWRPLSAFAVRAVVRIFGSRNVFTIPSVSTDLMDMPERIDIDADTISLPTRCSTSRGFLVKHVEKFIGDPPPTFDSYKGYVRHHSKSSAQCRIQRDSAIRINPRYRILNCEASKSTFWRPKDAMNDSKTH